MGGVELSQRPLLRQGELLEAVPGMIVTAHTGGGKANQYYLRGFNLDHGTDFATFVEGVPVNLGTHAHGQGYMDLNWLLPELVSGITFRKGNYYADVGDFASAGSAEISYVDKLPRDFLTLEGGTDNYGRALFAGSAAVGSGKLLYAGEYIYYDGPFLVSGRYRRPNGLLKYSVGGEDGGGSVTTPTLRSRAPISPTTTRSSATGFPKRSTVRSRRRRSCTTSQAPRASPRACVCGTLDRAT